MVTLSIDEYLSDVCEKEKFPKIIYSKETHHEVIPEIITIAGVLDAVPMDMDWTRCLLGWNMRLSLTQEM